MEIKLTSTIKSITIDGNEFSFDAGDPDILQANDGLLEYLGTLKESNNVVVTHQMQCDFIRKCFGDEQLAEIEKIQPINFTNANILTAALFSAISEVVTDSSVNELLESLGIAKK